MHIRDHAKPGAISFTEWIKYNYSMKSIYDFSQTFPYTMDSGSFKLERLLIV